MTKRWITMSRLRIYLTSFGLLFLVLILCLLFLSRINNSSQIPPNIIIILADDLGFSDIASYGGEIDTPNLDFISQNGLRFDQFYNTSRCWSTRSSILTGFYPQQIRMDPPSGKLPEWAHLLPYYLKRYGYKSYHSGKWHITGAPFPVADGGFDNSYMLEDTDRFFSPQVHLENDHSLPPVARDTDYYATTGITDYALGMLRHHISKEQRHPFFLYLAYTAPHFPLHAPSSDIERYKDRYSEGWDTIRERRWEKQKALGFPSSSLPPFETQLTPRYWQEEWKRLLGQGETEHAVPWNQLTQAQKKFQAEKMRIHAAMVTRMDLEIGRIIEQLRQTDSLENTVIFFLSDNGSDATIMVRGDGHDQKASPGSMYSFLTLGPGWSTVSNTPFRRHKMWTHEGGISTPLIVYWPKEITKGGLITHQMGHVIDLVPTALELAGSNPKSDFPLIAKRPLPGKSLVPLLKSNSIVERQFLFFSHEGSRAIRSGRWKLTSAPEDGNRWQLYDLKHDRSELFDLSKRFPNRVTRLAKLWETKNAEYQMQATGSQP